MPAPAPAEGASSAATASTRSLTALFLEPRDQLGEIAWARTEIELRCEQLVPTRRARARRARQAEDIRRVRDACEAARLEARGADLVERDRAKELTETFDLLVEQHPDRLGRAVAAREPRATRRDDHLDLGVGDPGGHNGADRIDVV